MKSCPNCGSPLGWFDQPEDGMEKTTSMESETSLGELSSILVEVGCDAIPERLHKLTLEDLDRWMAGR